MDPWEISERALEPQMRDQRMRERWGRRNLGSRLAASWGLTASARQRALNAQMKRCYDEELAFEAQVHAQGQAQRAAQRQDAYRETVACLKASGLPLHEAAATAARRMAADEQEIQDRRRAASARGDPKSDSLHRIVAESTASSPAKASHSRLSAQSRPSSSSRFSSSSKPSSISSPESSLRFSSQSNTSSHLQALHPNLDKAAGLSVAGRAAVRPPRTSSLPAQGPASKMLASQQSGYKGQVWQQSGYKVLASQYIVTGVPASQTTQSRCHPKEVSSNVQQCHLPQNMQRTAQQQQAASQVSFPPRTSSTAAPFFKSAAKTPASVSCTQALQSSHKQTLQSNHKQTLQSNYNSVTQSNPVRNSAHTAEPVSVPAPVYKVQTLSHSVYHRKALPQEPSGPVASLSLLVSPPASQASAQKRGGQKCGKGSMVTSQNRLVDGNILVDPHSHPHPPSQSRPLLHSRCHRNPTARRCADALGSPGRSVDAALVPAPLRLRAIY